MHEATEVHGRSEPGTGAVGVLTIDGLDKRTRPFKRYEAIRAAVCSDLGGNDNLSEVQRQMVSKFATLGLQLECMEAAALAGEEIDIDLFGRCAGHMRRIAEAIGFKRIARGVPELSDYIEAKAGERVPTGSAA